MIQNEKTHQPRLSLSPFICAAALLLAAAGVGCQTTNSASFASVVIKGKSNDQIAAATARVFAADGYRGGMIGPDQMMFEKEASRGTTYAREGVVGGVYGASTIKRVRVEMEPLGGGSTRLQCKAYMVTGGSDPFFQNESPLANMRSGPYKSLLKQVAKQLE
jgi:hypothetical protein